MKIATKDKDDMEGMEDNPLHEAFLDELADILDAELQLLKALPKVEQAVGCPDLKTALGEHLEQTRRHVDRLRQVGESVGEELEPKTCRAMKGLLAEAEEHMAEHEGKDSFDAITIACAQKVEHYEIATYGTLLAWARLMGHSEAANLLEETLHEEESADATLTEIAVKGVNDDANESEDER